MLVTQKDFLVTQIYIIIDSQHAQRFFQVLFSELKKEDKKLEIPQYLGVFV